MAVVVKNSPIRRIESELAAQRERDIARVIAGAVSPAQMRRENGAFGRAIARSGGIDWQRAARAL